MADGAGAEGGGPFDPLPLPDNFEDVLHLLDLSGLNNAEPVPPPPPAAAPVHYVDHTACSRGCSGDDLLDWSAMLDNYPIGDGAPSATAAPPSGLPVHGGPSTSTSSAAQQADVLDCTGCQVLREVVHSNGFEATKLCIHGEAGVFYHATLDVYLINSEGLAPALTHHSNVDFRGRYYEWVKHYLTDYALRRAGGNFAVVHDSLAAFHDVLCTTMNRGSHVDDAHTGAAARNGGDQLIIRADAIQPTIQGYVQPASGPSQPSYTTDVERPFRSVVRTALAIQRERTGKLQLHDIAPYFHLPIAKAATKLDICPTALKGICRKYGVPRWPQRKVRSIDRQIAKLTRSGNGDAARNEIERLSASRRRIFAGLE